MPKILGIDLGKDTGWGLLGDGRPRFGTLKIVSQWQPFGDCMLVLEDKLHKLILKQRPDRIAVARPFVRKSKGKMYDTPQNLLPMYGAFTTLMMLAATMKIPVDVVEEGAARSRLVGKNMLRRKSADAKADVMLAWVSRGLDVKTSHEGDALCVAMEGRAMAVRGREYETTPLFEAAATVRPRRAA